jgi:AAA+ superfamily predicted ATPase
MARADLLVRLVRAGVKGDQVTFRQTVEQIIAEERAVQHNVLAERLAEYLRLNGSPHGAISPRPDDRSLTLFHEVLPQRRLQDLILPQPVLRACEELAEEHHRGDLLRAHQLEPRSRVLLAGPPGNGKTSLAEAIAEALMVPLLIVRYEGVIASYLGETASRLQRLFEFVRTRHCVLFFDEFDAIGKERGDVHETGEIKRVVSSLLLQVDALPSFVVVITATNHPELLDRAVWRRFQLRLELPPPTRAQREEWFRRLQEQLATPLGMAPRSLADRLVGTSFSELEDFSVDVLRRIALAQPTADVASIVTERVAQWRTRFRPSNIVRPTDAAD